MESRDCRRIKKVYAKLACHSIGDETANLANGTLNDILLAEKIEQWLILQAMDKLGARQSITQDPAEIALKIFLITSTASKSRYIKRI